MGPFVLFVFDTLLNRPTTLLWLLPVFFVTLLVFFVGVVPLSRRLRVKSVGVLQLVLLLAFVGPFVLALGALIYGYSTDFAAYFRYIHGHGERGELVVASYRSTGVRVNHVDRMEGVGFLKVAGGRSVEVVISMGPVPQYPPVEGFVPLPGKVYAARYLPDAPERFVLDQGSEGQAARRSRCGPLAQELESIKARLLLEPADAELQSRQRAITADLATDCMP